MKFVEEGMAEKVDIDNQYRNTFCQEFVNILFLTRKIEDEDPGLRV